MTALFNPHPWTKYLLVGAETGADAERYNKSLKTISEIAPNVALPDAMKNTILTKIPTGRIQLLINGQGSN